MKKMASILLSMATFNSFVFGMYRDEFSNETKLAVAENRADVFYGIRQCDKKRFDFGWPTHSQFLSNMLLRNSLANAPSSKQVLTDTSDTSMSQLSVPERDDSVIASLLNSPRSLSNERQQREVVLRAQREKTDQEKAQEELDDLSVLVENKCSRAPHYTAGWYKFRQSVKGFGNGLGSLLGLGVIGAGISGLYTGFIHSDGFEKLVGTGAVGAGLGLAGLFGFRAYKNAAHVYYADGIVKRRQSDIQEIKKSVNKFREQILRHQENDCLGGKGEEE